MQFISSRRLPALVMVLIGVTVTACGTEAGLPGERPDAVSAQPGVAAAVGDMAAAPGADSVDRVRDSLADSPADRASDATTAPAGADTAARPAISRDSATSAGATVVSVTVNEGRSRRDSLALVRTVRAGLASDSWPVDAPAPAPRAILPDSRIVAYYGNPLSRRMGALGEYSVDEMLERLGREVDAWRAADPDTPVRPALHLIAVVAQAAPGWDGNYRARMADTLVERVYSWAQSANALLFLDVQVGLSTLQAELPRLEKFLSRPDVHLGIDPEFAMKNGAAPGTRIGSFDAADINYATQFLAEVSERHDLPPKVLVVHRFTSSMVTNTPRIELRPRVQIVMHMDGWGAPWLKFDSYREFILRDPVQFTGFKLFYKNDTRSGDALLTPMELVQLVPAPVYIQYQ